jgi:hypothetical protein
MKGYLMAEKVFTRGENFLVESNSPENKFGVVFEDDGETGYFYGVQTDAGTGELTVLDALHIYELQKGHRKHDPSKLLIIWSKDWLKCALVLDDHCHAIFDFENHGGYNINEFPPPNSIWTKKERKLTQEIIRELF